MTKTGAFLRTGRAHRSAFRGKADMAPAPKNVRFAGPIHRVVVKRRGNPPMPWRWEIYCACKAVPIERSPVFFESAAAAAKDGKKTLTHLLAR